MELAVSLIEVVSVCGEISPSTPCLCSWRYFPCWAVLEKHFPVSRMAAVLLDPFFLCATLGVGLDTAAAEGSGSQPCSGA